MTAPYRFRAFIIEREEARMVKELLGGPGPHSTNPIIAVNRFCNVDREDDTVTRWVHKNIRLPYQSEGHSVLLTQVLAGRIFNQPSTLERILPVRDTAAMAETLRVMQEDEGLKIMRGVYMVGAHGPRHKGVPVREYYARVISQAQQLRWETMPELETVAGHLMTIDGMGAFMANQVCADLRYTVLWKDAPDWDTFVLCGPGSRRGLDRYDGQYRRHGSSRSEAAYTARVLEIREELRAEAFPLVRLFRDPNNLSNCFCEFDKYERVLHGEAARLHTYP